MQSYTLAAIAASVALMATPVLAQNVNQSSNPNGSNQSQNAQQNGQNIRQQLIQSLPPLQTMERLLFQLIALGFFLLSLTLISAAPFVHDLVAQHLARYTAAAQGAIPVTPSVS